MLLCAAAGLSLLIGAGLTIRSLGDIDRARRVLDKKHHDTVELTALKKTADRYHTILERYAAYPAVPPRFEAIARSEISTVSILPRATETRPSVTGWTVKTLKLGLTDIGGADLSRLLEAAATATPPWTAVEGTLTAAPTAGRLATVELAVETVERQDPAN